MKRNALLPYSLLGVLFLAAACGGKTSDTPSGGGSSDKKTTVEADAGTEADDNASNTDAGGEVTSDNDLDGDGIVDELDEDIDGDGVANEKDGDLDGDGIINEEDEDLDGDGIDNIEDEDIDGDGIVNDKDDDIDGDGIVNDNDDNSKNLVVGPSGVSDTSVDPSATAADVDGSSEPAADGMASTATVSGGATAGGTTSAGSPVAVNAAVAMTSEVRPDDDSEFFSEVSIDLADIAIPDECQQEYLYASTDGCEMGLSCENSYSNSYCYINEIDDSGNEVWWCGCSGENDYTEFSVGNTTAEELCPAAMELCAAGEVPVTVTPDAEPVCATQYREASTDWCNVNVVCSEEATVGDMLTVELQENKQSYCDRVGDDDWQCSCYDNESSLQFSISDVEAPLDVCTDVREMCDAGTIEGNGDITCKPQSVNAGDNYCSASVRCSQSGTLGDSDIEAMGSAGVYCDLDSGQNWSCQCYTGEEAFTVSGSDGFDVCLAAVTPCEAAVIESGTLNGNNGGGVFFGGGDIAVAAGPRPASSPVALEETDEGDMASSDDTTGDESDGDDEPADGDNAG